MSPSQLLLLATPFVLGALFLWLARWSRRRALRHPRLGRRESTRAVLAAFRGGRLRDGLDQYFNRDLPRGSTALGVALSVLVIVAVAGTLVWAGALLAAR